jgi:tetratricopeptide (TPR) repeat protein
MEGNEEAAWKFARASYWVGVRIDNMEQKELIFDKAYKVVRPYYDAGSQDLNTLYWFALNAGKYGNLHGVLRTLFLVKPIKSSCLTIVNKDPGHEDGGAYIILGILEYKVPGGDLDVCLDYLNKALSYRPNNIPTNLYLGYAYYDKEEYSKAKERLEHLLATGKPETKDDRDYMAEGEELLKKVNEELNK